MELRRIIKMNFFRNLFVKIGDFFYRNHASALPLEVEVYNVTSTPSSEDPMWEVYEAECTKVQKYLETCVSRLEGSWSRGLTVDWGAIRSYKKYGQIFSPIEDFWYIGLAENLETYCEMLSTGDVLTTYKIWSEALDLTLDWGELFEAIVDPDSYYIELSYIDVPLALEDDTGSHYLNSEYWNMEHVKGHYRYMLKNFEDVANVGW
jgi:hypothetical protein